MQKQYKNFYDMFEKHITNQYEDSMLEQENANNDDYWFNALTLQNVSSCAEASNDPERFWVSFQIEISMEDSRTGDIAEPMVTKYYLKTATDRISLIHDTMNENFTELWMTPEMVEKDLIKALLTDMLLLNENCLQGLTPPTFSSIFEGGYAEISQLSVDTKMKYYNLFGTDSMLPDDVKEMFIF